MNHNDDAYATMLLTMALSPDKEEYARPCGTQEFRRLVEAVRAAGLRGPGKLLGMDISGLMAYLNLTEEEGYWVFTLLNRTVQLSYALEGYIRANVDVVTLYDAGYPERLTRRLGEAAPPFFYRAGRPDLLDRPAIALMGISGVRTTPEVRDAVNVLVRDAARLGYGILTGGELGVSRIAAGAAAEQRVPVVEVLGGDMKGHLGHDEIRAALDEGLYAAVSLVHPEAMFTVPHAIARNKVIFALADAAFIFNTDGKRGEGDALRTRACDWIYAWEGCPANGPLIAHGATPFRDAAQLDLNALSRLWNSSQAQQLNLFDLL